MPQLEDTLVRWILSQGLDKFDASMLPNELKEKVFSSAARAFFRKGDFSNAIKSLSYIDNKQLLVDFGDNLMQLNKFREATFAYIYSGHKEKIEHGASLCIKAGEFNLALKAYEASGNTEMVNFIKKNSD